MTEQEWLTCKSPYQMITFLLKRKVSDRKVRLFACSWFHEKERFESVAEIVAVGERLADGIAQPHEVGQVRIFARNTSSIALLTISNDIVQNLLVVLQQEDIFLEEDLFNFVNSIHDIFGNPFCPVSFDSNWRTQKVLALANTIYDQKAYDLMPILADELEDAGCANVELLSHCRGVGPHVRGCWAVDQALGKN